MDIYGVHAVVLPFVGDPAAPYGWGWVMLWGLGRERHDPEDDNPEDVDIPRLNAWEAEPDFYPPNRFVNRAALTSILLWNPAVLPDEPPLTMTDRKHAYGYVRYLFDHSQVGSLFERTPWTVPGHWPAFNLFCSGHALLPNGRLLAVGGNIGMYTRDDSQGTVSGHGGLRLVATFNHENFQPSDVSLDQPLWSWQWGLYEPRWYPSVVSLHDGRTLIVGGWQVDPPVARRTHFYEFYELCTDQLAYYGCFRIPTEYVALRESYPRLLMVSYRDSLGAVKARVLHVGSYDIENDEARRIYYLEPPWDSQPNGLITCWKRASVQLRAIRIHGTAVLLPNYMATNPQNLAQQVLNQVMVLGGGYGSSEWDSQFGGYVRDAHSSTEIVSVANDTGVISRSDGPTLQVQRAHLNAVLLPTGQLLIVGGIHGLFHPENPPAVSSANWLHPDQLARESELLSWTGSGWMSRLLAPAPADDRDSDGIVDGARVYHSTALLLPDGRVLTAGSSVNAWVRASGGGFTRRGVHNYVPTIYSPPYLFKPDGTRRGDADRPQIVSLSDTELNYGQQFELEYRLADDSAGIQSAVLVRPSSVTHSTNFEQRLVRLHFKQEDPLIQVTAPWHPAIAPPGWYMLFLVDENNTPSKAVWVYLSPLSVCTLNPSTVELQLEGVDQLSAEQAAAMENEPLTLEFRNPATGTTLQTFTLPMARPDSSGQVALEVWTDLPAGGYEVYVRPYRSWLGQRVRVNWQPGGRLLIPLRNGDVVKDNQVDYADLVLVLEMQGATGLSEADVNADGVVDEQDAAIVAQNVGEVGDE